MRPRSCFRLSVRGVACGCTPYGGANPRTLGNIASVRSARTKTRTLAHSMKSELWRARGCASVRVNFSVRADVVPHAHPHTEIRGGNC